ncbi:hypothetical protein CC85DRAFT_288376 [Cutaneotrichosporon oleaginosum]|uniref:Protein phosphatase n=1 Tax=Cutaneotrichosporon oleaginosum TaxID=879819 RepID=A0A0J1AWB8_9TREE|nr:uncharacterized protein CC85DRAFT_288376 [Cutaneotrichosporon oleaginosum]KLT39579.1 hypothetical protein CC85DRAFT_288376 [Cutaneotrichosporon oleaginosum]TXT15493.1 hypothetical protein COLE_01686 [Cutaneotrichosporon oleaginosum]
MRATRAILDLARPVSSRAPPPLVYNLGISYAAKHSPPFVPHNAHPASAGFSGQPSKLGKWVDTMKALPAGRGELEPTKDEHEAGKRELDLQMAVNKWGAGEDFFAVVSTDTFTHIAASDGVGGWAPQFDPSLYSQALMFHYAQALTASPSMAPWEALNRAYAAVEADDNVKAGSATAVGVSMGETGKGQAINLGDSGLTILRNGKPVFESLAQTHFFNCPYQLSKTPPSMRSPDLITDTPAQADKFEFDLEPGDVVLLYTDGMSDNLPAERIPLLNAAVLQTLELEANADLSVEEKRAAHARLLADVLVAASRYGMCFSGEEDLSKGGAWKTPFEIEAKKNRRDFIGGKIDDVTVLAVTVAERLG